MIDDLKPYSAYKDSGVAWLGEVPEHWEVPRLGSLLKERHETNAHGQVTEVLSVLRNIGVIPYSEKGRIGNKKSEDITRYKIVRPNDIVVNCMNVIIGSVGLSKYTGCLSPVYYVLTRCSEYDDPNYLSAYFQNTRFQESLVRIGNGILSHRMRIPMELLKCELFLRPPLEEQTAIATFLDYADRRIRRYIRSKQKLIKLLEEQKQIVVNDAVIRGLDPNVALKFSGVEWLGDIPAHWEVKRLKMLFREVDSRSTTGSEVLLSLRMHRGLVPHYEVSDKPIGEEVLKGFKKVVPGQLVMNRMRAAIGMFGTVPQAGIISPDYAVFEPRQSASPHYYVHLFKTSTLCSIFRLESKGLGTGSSGFMRLYTDRFGLIKVPIPPKEEQEAITLWIQETTQEIETAKQKATQEILLLNEFRTRLIADVVTGKLDVREAASKLLVY